jgi:hypothetical protein
MTRQNRVTRKTGACATYGFRKPPFGLTTFTMEVRMTPKKLREFLDSHGIPYTTISHTVVYTAKESFVAASCNREQAV